MFIRWLIPVACSDELRDEAAAPFRQCCDSYGGFRVNVRELMSRNFHALYPAASIAKALEIFQEATELEGRRIFGLMVAAV
jgi:hypothetical protein